MVLQQMLSLSPCPYCIFQRLLYLLIGGLALLGFVGTLVIVGYGTDTLDFNLSRLMALDAQVVGSWGCAPEHYDTVLTRVLAGDIAIAPFVELQPMRRIREVFAAAHAGELTRRVILTPDF